jgi:hypothetical protein
MAAINNMRQLFNALARGALIVQRYVPRWEGDSPRNIYYVEHNGRRLTVCQTTAVAAIQTTRLQAVPRDSDDAQQKWRDPNFKGAA